MRICGISTPKCRSLLNGTTTKSWRTGGLAKRSTAAATTREVRCFSPPVDAALSRVYAVGIARLNRAASTGNRLRGSAARPVSASLRSYRGANAQPTTQYGPDAYLLGPVQLAWLKRELKRSSATWKIIASDTLLGTIACGPPHPHAAWPRPRDRRPAVIHGPCRRSQHDLDHRRSPLHRGTHFDPSYAVFQDFEPFWEFVSGPIHAGTWTPCVLDWTFGPKVVFQSAASHEQGDNLAPSFGLQFFGHVAIDGKTETLTITLKDVDDRALWAKTLEPKSDQSARRLWRPFPGRRSQPRRLLTGLRPCHLSVTQASMICQRPPPSFRV